MWIKHLNLKAISSKELKEIILDVMKTRPDLNREKVLHDVKNQLRPLLEFFKKNEDKIGKFLSKTSLFEKLENPVIGNCPDCKSGNLVIIHSKKTKKRFIGCTNYFRNDCDTSFPLPQSGSVKTTQKKCKYCSWTQVIVEFQGKKPWYLCFNPDCSLKSSS